MSTKRILALVSVAALAASIEVVSFCVVAGWAVYGTAKLLTCVPVN